MCILILVRFKLVETATLYTEIPVNVLCLHFSGQIRKLPAIAMLSQLCQDLKRLNKEAQPEAHFLVLLTGIMFSQDNLLKNGHILVNTIKCPL